MAHLFHMFEVNFLKFTLHPDHCSAHCTPGHHLQNSLPHFPSPSPLRRCPPRVSPPWHFNSLWGQAPLLPLRPDKAAQLEEHILQDRQQF